MTTSPCRATRGSGNAASPRHSIQLSHCSSTYRRHRACFRRRAAAQMHGSHAHVVGDSFCATRCRNLNGLRTLRSPQWISTPPRASDRSNVRVAPSNARGPRRARAHTSGGASIWVHRARLGYEVRDRTSGPRRLCSAGVDGPSARTARLLVACFHLAEILSTVLRQRGLSAVRFSPPDDRGVSRQSKRSPALGRRLDGAMSREYSTRRATPVAGGGSSAC